MVWLKIINEYKFTCNYTYNKVMQKEHGIKALILLSTTSISYIKLCIYTMLEYMSTDDQ